jgi:hypothetical protein
MSHSAMSHVVKDYFSEQLAATILPDSTLNAGVLGAVDPAADSGGAAAPFCSSSVPVSARTFPTCGLNAVGFAISA